MVTTRVNWKPEGCQNRYTQPYVFSSEIEGEKDKQPEPKTFQNAESQTDPQNPLCCGCRQPVIEPFSFGCSHFFCKRCIAETKHILETNFKERVKDPRATMKCPVKICKSRIDCLPLLNGDFRFFQHRPLPPAKIVKGLKDASNEEESLRMSMPLHMTDIRARFGCFQRR